MNKQAQISDAVSKLKELVGNMSDRQRMSILGGLGGAALGGGGAALATRDDEDKGRKGRAWKILAGALAGGGIGAGAGYAIPPRQSGVLGTAEDDPGLSRLLSNNPATAVGTGLAARSLFKADIPGAAMRGGKDAYMRKWDEVLARVTELGGGYRGDGAPQFMNWTGKTVPTPGGAWGADDARDMIARQSRRPGYDPYAAGRGGALRAGGKALLKSLPAAGASILGGAAIDKYLVQPGMKDRRMSSGIQDMIDQLTKKSYDEAYQQAFIDAGIKTAGTNAPAVKEKSWGQRKMDQFREWAMGDMTLKDVPETPPAAAAAVNTPGVAPGAATGATSGAGDAMKARGTPAIVKLRRGVIKNAPLNPISGGFDPAGTEQMTEKGFSVNDGLGAAYDAGFEAAVADAFAGYSPNGRNR